MATMLFFDDWCLESHRNVVRKLGKPTWLPEATLEGDLTKGIANFPLVYRDSESNRWRAIYQGVVGATEELSATPTDVPVLLMAESDDGLHWTKPDLRQALGGPGMLVPNQVLKHDDIYDRGPVYFDPQTTDPEQRLKAVCVYERQTPGGDRVFRQRMAYSADGLHWTVEDRVWNNWHCSDGPYPIFWNAQRGVYTIMTRPQQAERRIVRIDTTDFHTFDGPYRVLSPDPLDLPLTQFYGMPVFPYEGMFVGLLWMLQGDPYEVKLLKRNGPIEAHLTYSCDGMAFNRTFREPFIPRNPRGEEGGGCIYPTSMLAADDGSLRFYSGSSRGEHYRHLDERHAALLVHTLRRDGFVYLESYSCTGSVMTRCLHLDEPLDLSLNVRAPYGGVRVQLSDRFGRALPGYSFDECVRFRGDQDAWRPRWNSASVRASLSGDVGRIEVELTDAELYAIRGNFEWMRIPEVRNFRADESQVAAFDATLERSRRRPRPPTSTRRRQSRAG